MTKRLSPQREAETFASMDDRGVPEPSDAEEKRARLFGFVEAGATEGDLPTFAAALNDYVAAELTTVRAELAEAELMRDFTDFHLRQLSDQRGEAESANEAWELGQITAEEALRRTDAAIQGHKAITLDQFRAEREARS